MFVIARPRPAPEHLFLAFSWPVAAVIDRPGMGGARIDYRAPRVGMRWGEFVGGGIAFGVVPVSLSPP